MGRLASGFSVSEVTVALAVVSIGLFMMAPPLVKLSAALRVRLAAEELVSVLRMARSLAVRQNVNVAVRFATEPSGAVTFGLYRDADGDGVLNADIRAGVDKEIAPPRRLMHVGRDVHLGLPDQRVRDPGDPHRWLEAGGDPVRFNDSNLASFSPLGGATPGSLYVTDGHERLAVVRVLGTTGKVRVLVYDFASQTWRQ